MTAGSGPFGPVPNVKWAGYGQAVDRILGARAGRRTAQAARAVATVARSRNLRRALSAFGAAWTAEWAITVALGVVAFRAGGASAVGVVAFVRTAPAALVAPFGSALGDRFRRERVLAWSCAVRAGATAAAAALLAVDAPVVGVYALAVVATAAFAVVRPVHSALLPGLCATPLELTSAHVVRGFLDSLSMLAGPLLAALLLELASASSVLGLAALLAGWSGLLLLGLSYDAPPRPRPPPLRRILGEMGAGFRALHGSREAAAIVRIAVAQVFTRGCLTVLLVVMAVELLGTGEPGVGVLTGAVGAGALVGSIGVSLLVTGRHLAAISGTGVVLWGGPLVLAALVPQRATVLVLLAAVGVGNALVDVGLFLLPARFVPEELLARFFGALESVIAVAVAVGSLVTPPLVAGLDVRGALAVVGLVAPLVVGSAWRWLRAIDRSVEHRDAEIGVLRRVGMLQPLPMPAIENLARHVERLEAAAGSAIVRQGERGDSYYVIERGAADVVGDGARIGSLGPGDGFGEIALLHDRPRTATVVARTPLALCRIDRAHFLASVGTYGSSSTAAGRVAAERLDTFDPVDRRDPPT